MALRNEFDESDTPDRDISISVMLGKSILGTFDEIIKAYIMGLKLEESCEPGAKESSDGRKIFSVIANIKKATQILAQSPEFTKRVDFHYRIIQMGDSKVQLLNKYFMRLKSLCVPIPDGYFDDILED